ncbi:MAG: hypothetical protein ACI8ZN_000297 [Bacteroidia bacterium]|jgi:hypothetical protein
MGYLLVSEARAGYEVKMRDPIIIKVDSNGKEVWRLDFVNDTFCGLNVVVAPLANGNYIATYLNTFYKPYMKPDEVRDVVLFNREVSTLFVEFNPTGQIVNRWNLDEELRYQLSFENLHQNEHNRMINTNDGGIALAGTTYFDGEFGL